MYIPGWIFIDRNVITVSLGEPKSAYLEDIWAQTQVLFDMLAVNGRFSAGLIDLEYDIMTRCT